VTMAGPGLRSCSAFKKWWNSTTVSLGSIGVRKKRGFYRLPGAGHGNGEVAARSGGGGSAKYSSRGRRRQQRSHEGVEEVKERSGGVLHDQERAR
jgi:hypothetical protein